LDNSDSSAGYGTQNTIYESLDGEYNEQLA